jgi:hypothetical protein
LYEKIGKSLSYGAASPVAVVPEREEHATIISEKNRLVVCVAMAVMFLHSAPRQTTFPASFFKDDDLVSFLSITYWYRPLQGEAALLVGISSENASRIC